MDPRYLTDTDLTAELGRLAATQRHTTVALVSHLAEFAGRRLHLRAGYPSLFAYCTAVLRLSEHEAYHRIYAARTSRRFPVLLEGLREGRLTLSTLRLLGPHLTRRNHLDLLGEAEGRSKREVQQLLSRRSPSPDVPSSVRKLRSPIPAPNVASPLEPTPVVLTTEAQPRGAEPLRPATVVAPAPRPTVVAPLSVDRYEIRFTARGETREKLRRAQELLSHAVPNGDVAEVFDRALTLLIEELERRKFGASVRPRVVARVADPRSRHVPAAVRRAVHVRDGGRCAYVAPDGRRCGSARFLEFHHVRPYAVGGEPTVDGIQLRCGPHNRYEAEVYFAADRARNVDGPTRSGPSPG
jgi:hypothetical protein